MTSNRRKQLEDASFPDLDTMMAAYAASAVETAREDYRQRLDYNSESMVAFEAVLSELAEKRELDYDFEVKLWGSYLGEVLRRRYAGSWEMTQYPRRGGGCACGRGTRIAAVSADEGLPAHHHGRCRKHCRVFRYGDGAAGKTGAGELN